MGVMITDAGVVSRFAVKSGSAHTTNHHKGPKPQPCPWDRRPGDLGGRRRHRGGQAGERGSWRRSVGRPRGRGPDGESGSRPRACRGQGVSRAAAATSLSNRPAASGAMAGNPESGGPRSSLSPLRASAPAAAILWSFHSN
jgi:hypothetical protein